VSLTLESGCTGLLGNNGAGKSTLIKSLLGQLPIRPGAVLLLGLDPARTPLAVRQKVGYMPESDVYLPGLTGLEFAAFCGELSGLRPSDATSRAHAMLHFVGLGEARYRPIDDYSTGMRQRAKLAACLVHGPELVLLDEPTTGLDPAGRDEMLALIADLAHARGVSVLLSSHILPDIERTADRLVVLNEGRLLFSGARADFQREEAQRVEVRVKAGREVLAEALRAAGCEVAADPGQAHLQVILPEGQGPRLVWQTARAQGVQIRGLATAAASLDQAYNQAVVGGGSRP